MNQGLLLATVLTDGFVGVVNQTIYLWKTPRSIESMISCTKHSGSPTKRRSPYKRLDLTSCVEDVFDPLQQVRTLNPAPRPTASCEASTGQRSTPCSSRIALPKMINYKCVSVPSPVPLARKMTKYREFIAMHDRGYPIPSEWSTKAILTALCRILQK